MLGDDKPETMSLAPSSPVRAWDERRLRGRAWAAARAQPYDNAASMSTTTALAAVILPALTDDQPYVLAGAEAGQRSRAAGAPAHRHKPRTSAAALALPTSLRSSHQTAVTGIGVMQAPGSAAADDCLSELGLLSSAVR